MSPDSSSGFRGGATFERHSDFGIPLHLVRKRKKACDETTISSRRDGVDDARVYVKACIFRKFQNL